MGIIDVNIDRPALKRTDVVEGPPEPDRTDAAEDPVEESTSGGRLRRTGAIAGGVLAVGMGAFTLRKLRRRRSGNGDSASADGD